MRDSISVEAAEEAGGFGLTLPEDDLDTATLKVLLRKFLGL